MKKIALILAILYSSVSYSQETIIDSETGIKIIFSAEGKIFPDSWYSTRINAQGISLDKSEYLRSEKIIKDVLRKYPKEVLTKNLKEIYILNNIKFFDQEYGGTNSTEKVYLSNKGISEGYSNHYIEQLFHAEFSSILLRNNKQYLNENEWKSNNIDGFNYGKSGVDALKNNKSSERFDSTLNENGFINEYATSTLENDFNSFAKNLFLPKSGFDVLLKHFDKLRNKRNLIIKFYNRISPSLNEAFFNEILSPTKTQIVDPVKN